MLNFSLFDKFISLNFNGLRKSKPDHTVIVAQRFLQLFKDHNVAVPQIPRLISDITLEKLRSPEALISALNNKIINQSVKLFQVRREWLEGLDKKIYNPYWCYKAPGSFFQDIAGMKTVNAVSPIMVFCCLDGIDYRQNRDQPLALVLAEKVADFGENEIKRYKVYGDGWLWNYSKCRIQLKAMIRVWYEFSDISIPMYKVDHKTLELIREGYCVPSIYPIKGVSLRDTFFEDFVLSQEESRASKESEELPYVLNYIKSYNLEILAKNAFKKIKLAKI